MKIIWLVLLLPFLAQCSSSNSTSKHLPSLSSPARAQAWGQSLVLLTRDGYQKTYINPSNPKEILRIIASRQIMPFFAYPPNIKGIETRANTPQVWQSSSVNGTSINWYQSTYSSSNRASVFRTLGAELKDRSGGRGQFRIEAEGTKNQMRTWLSELRIGQ